jgi:hypothetical protein
MVLNGFIVLVLSFVAPCLYRNVHADPQPKREHGHNGEAGVLQQLAEGEFEVGHGLSFQFEVVSVQLMRAKS